ncbi:MAG: class I SAM-dependent methyltransferase [Caulobacterales bacterium]|uniref:class I SAM-dependent methyltransferase n=1 Tax=Glycocaulis sp. TaxID=1969725 RepID=UPI003F9EDE98
MSSTDDTKQQVHDFWNEAACGEALLLTDTSREAYDEQARERYRLEPYIPGFAGFENSCGLEVLEIGVGLGADHEQFARAGAVLHGIDLTPRAIEMTRDRLGQAGLVSNLSVGDAEALDFPGDRFDVVYSWGVLHHSPDTPRAIAEVHRVLRKGGEARVMIYHTWSMIGLMLWLRYGLLAGRPWRSLEYLYAHHLESPGTKAYTVEEARTMFAAFEDVSIETVLTHGDLLESEAGQRHRGAFLSLARKIWPRGLIRRLLPAAGLFMLIRARK